MTRGAPHTWPDDEEPGRAPARPRSRSRIARALGDVGLTIGLSQGLVHGRAGDGNRALGNAALLGEARSLDEEG